MHCVWCKKGDLELTRRPTRWDHLYTPIKRANIAQYISFKTHYICNNILKYKLPNIESRYRRIHESITEIAQSMYVYRQVKR